MPQRGVPRKSGGRHTGDSAPAAARDVVARVTYDSMLDRAAAVYACGPFPDTAAAFETPTGAEAEGVTEGLDVLGTLIVV